MERKKTEVQNPTSNGDEKMKKDGIGTIHAWGTKGVCSVTKKTCYGLCVSIPEAGLIEKFVGYGSVRDFSKIMEGEVIKRRVCGGDSQPKTDER